METIVVIQYVCVCSVPVPPPLSLSLYVYLPFISNLHLTPSWGKASHSSRVFVPVTSRAPPAYQYQLRQCWACNLQLNVILLNPIWKLNIEKPLAHLPVSLSCLAQPIYWPQNLQLSVPLSLSSCFAPCMTFCPVLFECYLCTIMAI